MKAVTEKTINANNAPCVGDLAARENNPPERNGPIVRPPAESICARPLIAPSTAWFGAQLVIYHPEISKIASLDVLASYEDDLPTEERWLSLQLSK